MLSPLLPGDPPAVGPYRLESRIGAGGMGVVYLGFDRGGQAAAVKVPHPHLADDAEFRARFRVEVSAARGIAGESVARVIDAEVDGSPPWLAAEYVQGPSLSAAVNRDGPLAGYQLDRFAAGLADAIMMIHAAGVVHRDLNPKNIVLSSTGPKVIDFGIARPADYSGITAVGNLIGTIAWMAPEQIARLPVGPAVDVFAWGVCTVFAATGRRAFPGDSHQAVAHQISTAAPLLDGVPDRLLPMVRAALAKPPEWRPTAAQLVRMLAGLPSTGREAGSRSSADTTTKLFSDATTTLWPPPDDHGQHGHPPRPSDHAAPPAGRRRRPVRTSLLFGVACLLCAAGIGLAVARAPFGDLFGVLAAGGVAALLAGVLSNVGGLVRTAIIFVAAVTGSVAGLISARLRDVDQPSRVLLQLAGAVVLAAVYTRIMRHRH